MRPTQGQAAVFEGNDAEPAILIAAESMRSEAHSERHMGAPQARTIPDRLLNDAAHGPCSPREQKPLLCFTVEPQRPPLEESSVVH
jgi:hypothetical protein